MLVNILSVFAIKYLKPPVIVPSFNLIDDNDSFLVDENGNNLTYS
jgi:hypothetical protein